MQKRPGRVVIEKISPSIDGGKYPVKRVIGDTLRIKAIIIADGHDLVAGHFYYREKKSRTWQKSTLKSIGNDCYVGEFPLENLGYYEFKVDAWIEVIETWCQAIEKKHQANEPIQADLLMGSEVLHHWLNSETKRSGWFLKREKLELIQIAEQLQKASPSRTDWQSLLEQIREFNLRYPYRYLLAEDKTAYPVWVDRKRAEFSSWYEIFPRSTSEEVGKHGTFKDCQKVLPYIANLGFNVIYFPPIHPIGKQFRKGPNNTLKAGPDDPGSPWAIGGEGGGHKAIHSKLGTMEDFKSLIKSASELDMEIALDLAFQCSADHPYLQEHPDWFKRRPDGSIQYAENPPKKYQDIYPFYFENEHFKQLWDELKNIVTYWIKAGVKMFRVDNPHTKPFPFWKWLISEVQNKYPDVIFLSEAFTRPNIVYHLAKIGFAQSYTYFTWRTHKQELEEYLMEVTQSEVTEYYRPNFWPNTPDILSGPLRNGNHAAFAIRFVLAATMTSNYGIYGPAFETYLNVPFSNKDEEYNHSEKYEIYHWSVLHQGGAPTALMELIKTVNQIRNSHSAFQSNQYVRLQKTDNSEVIAFTRRDPDIRESFLIIINLDSINPHAGWTDLSLTDLGLEEEQSFEVHDLLTSRSYQWEGSHNYFELSPQQFPAHIFKINTGSEHG